MRNLWKGGAVILLLLLSTMSAAAETLKPADAVLLLQTEPSASADVRVIPRDGIQGSNHTILVSGLQESENITIRILSDESGEAVFSTDEVADDNGRVELSIFSTEDDAPGVYIIEVLNRNEDVIGSAELTILEPEGRMGTVRILPESGEAGTTFLLEIAEVRPFAALDVAVRSAQDGLIYRTEVRADVDGMATVEFESERSLSGTFSVSVQEGQETVASGEFEITAVQIDVEISVQPREPEPNEMLLVSVTGLEAEETVTVEFLLDDEVLDSQEVVADVNGNLIARIPADAASAAGNYEVRVLRDEEEIASVEVAVGQQAQTATREVIITTTRQALTIGDSFTVNVGGLEADESVTFEIRYDGETVYSTERTANERGEFSINLVSSEDDEPGQYELVVIRDGEEVAASLITIEAAAQTTESEVSVTAVPDSIAAGERFTINVVGLEPGATITVDVRLEGESVFSTERSAGDEGSITLALTAEESDEPGEYDVIIIRDGEEIAVGSFTLTEATTQETPESDVEVSIEPDDFAQGDGFTVTVSGLEADETVNIDVRFDGASVFATERAADDDGVIQLRLTSSEEDQPGEYEVIVTRDGEELAAGEFSIAAAQTTPEETPEAPVSAVSIEADPQTLAQGDNVEVNIAGLEAGETVELDVRFEGEVVFTTERTADEDGNAVLILTSSDDDEPGDYEVAVLRDGEEIAAVTFTLTGATTEETPPQQVAEAQVNIEPASGIRGTNHIVQVTGLEAGETVELQVEFEDEVIFSTFLTANDEGAAETQLVSEESDEAGDYTINILRGDRVIGSGILTIEEVVTEEEQPNQEQEGDTDVTPEQEQEGDTEGELEEEMVVAEGASEIITGSLTQEEPEQRVSFSGEEGDSVLISLSSNDFDTYLTLLDEQGNILTSNDDSNQSLNSQIGPFTLPYSGEYTILVGSYSYSTFGEASTGDYTLTIERVGLSDIAYGDTVEVTFAEDSFTQFFSFDANAGDVISVTVDSGGSVDTVLSLLDPEGFSVFTDDDGGAGLDPEMTRFVIPNSGTYILTLRTFTPGSEGNASLTLNLNDVRTLDEESRTVVLNGKQNRDVLTLTGEAGEAIQLNIAVESGNPGDLNVSVVQNGQSLMYYQSFGIPSEITLGFVIPEDGEVTIFVEDYSGAASSFTVSIERE